MNAVVDVDRLAKLCGMFGSDHLGERAAAAAKAHDLVHSAGMTWPELFGRPNRASANDSKTSWQRELTPSVLLSTYGAALTGWERCFLAGLVKRSDWTPRQREVLADIQRRFQ